MDPRSDRPPSIYVDRRIFRNEIVRELIAARVRVGRETDETLRRK